MQHAISQKETRSNANVRMPIDVNGWWAGIANTKHCYCVHVKQQSNSTFSDYSISILRISIYLYVFIISSLPTSLLSVCATVKSMCFTLRNFHCPLGQINTLWYYPIPKYQFCIITGTHASYNLFSVARYKTRSYLSDLSHFLYLHPCIERDVWTEDNIH